MSREERFAPSVPTVLLLTGMVFFALYPRLLLSPLLVRLADDLGIDYRAASAFFVTASFGFVAGLLASGFVAGRLAHYRTILLSTWLSGVTLLAVAFVTRPFTFHVLVALIGFGNGLYPGSGIASVTAVVHERHHGKALAIHESGPNLAFIAAPLVAALLAPLVGWRAIFVASGVLAIAAGMLFLWLGPRETGRVDAPNFANLRLFLHNRGFWMLVLLFALAAAGSFGVYAVLPTFLIVEHGIAEATVNTLVGISRTSGFAAILASGALSDRFGFRPVAAVILIFSAVMTAAIGVTGGGLLLAVVFLQPLILQGFFPVAVVAVTASAPAAARNLAVVIPVVSANLVGAGLTPRAFGAFAGVGRFGFGFVVLGVLLAAGSAALRAVPAAPRPSSD